MAHVPRLRPCHHPKADGDHLAAPPSGAAVDGDTVFRRQAVDETRLVVFVDGRARPGVPYWLRGV